MIRVDSAATPATSDCTRASDLDPGAVEVRRVGGRLYATRPCDLRTSAGVAAAHVREHLGRLGAQHPARDVHTTVTLRAPSAPGVVEQLLAVLRASASHGGDDRTLAVECRLRGDDTWRPALLLKPLIAFDAVVDAEFTVVWADHGAGVVRPSEEEHVQV